MNWKILFAAALLLPTPQLAAQKIPLKTGEYSAKLQLDASTALPVHFSVECIEKQQTVIIRNASERILLHVSKKIGDTLILPFPLFDSELRVVASRKKRLDGFWVNYNKGSNYRIPFEAVLQSSKPGNHTNSSINISGNWESYFDPGSANPEVAVGVFEQEKDHVTGTFLTETGDYRFMEGSMEGNRFYLAAFDGSHAFLINGVVTDNVIQGTFHSGKHYHTNFRSVYNPGFTLKDPDSLTVLKKSDSEVSFTLKDLSGNDYVFPNAETRDKVVIIQIMGTWCPNCMDEAAYFKDLYNTYHNKGLEIIAIGYEAAETFDDQAAKIKRLKERQQLLFTFLVGGKASKDLAAQQFSMLNQVMSFPTSIFIGRDGQVKRIHTGFNGPGTGIHYTEYVEKTNALVEQLLNEK